ncbi:MAG: transketolase [Phycisphaerae bacterium]|nr:transketolase [Phycisphaerae bacterium]
MGQYSDLDRKVIKLGKMVVRMCTAAGSGHPSSALSILHLTTALMYRVMRYDPKNPWNTGADRLVLSEGHAVPAVYACYAELGGVAGRQDAPLTLTFDDCLTLRESASVLDGHPNPPQGFPFFDAATGSLGQGVSAAAGLACAARVQGSDKQIYVIVGDGESREGQIYEALDFIIDHKLTAVRVIFNANGQAQSDYVSPQQSAEALTKKLEAFGFDVKVIDGHNFDEIMPALTAPATDKPIAIVAKTVKGWGVNEFLTSNYHGKTLEESQVAAALADLDAKGAELGGDADADVAQLTTPQAREADAYAEVSAGTFEEACQYTGNDKAFAAKKMSTRKAYGVALAALGRDRRVTAMDGDVRGSTFAEYFFKKHPERFFEARIAEQNMISAGAGLAAGGTIPFVSSFAKFIVRGYDQIEMAAISEANLKISGSHAGISLAADGPSQMAITDLAFFRSMAHAKRTDGAPICRFFQPSDAISAFKLTELMANVEGMCYIRTARPDVPFIYDENEEFTVGGYKHLIDGEDLAIVTSGYMVHVAMKAAALIEERSGLRVSLIDAYSMPLATDEILQIGDDCRGQILVVEDNYAGGIVDEIAQAAAASDMGVMVHPLYLKKMPKSAKTPEDILAQVGLTAEDIAAAAQRIFDMSE